MNDNILKLNNYYNLFGLGYWVLCTCTYTKYNIYIVNEKWREKNGQNESGAEEKRVWELS